MVARLPLLAGLVVLALAIGLGSVAIAGGIRDRNRSDVITVTGSAKGVTSFKLTRYFEIRSPRVQAITGVAEHSSRLLAQGIPLSADPPQYIYTKLPSLRPELLATATKDAQRRGRVLVGSTGGHLGKLRNVDVGVFQVTSPNSTDVSDYGEYDTTTIQKDVTAVVDVTFALK